MRELSCFGDSSVGIAATAAAACDSGRGALDRSLQAATTTVYGASLHSGKELLIRVTWTRSAAGATGLAVAFDDALSPSSRCAHHVLHKKRGSRSFAPAAAGTAVGVHWDTTEATYASDSSPEPTGDYYLAVVADAELALLLGAGDAARDLSRRFVVGGGGAPRGAAVLSRREQLRGAAAAHTTRCRFREGGAEHEVAVHAIRGGEGEVLVSIDGKRVAEVRRVGWGFRGNRAAVLADGEVVDVMWDVHDWWFGRGGGGAGAGAGAQFMVRARAEKEGRLWMADQPPARGGFFLHVQCYRR
ncbi:hypothetical protein E2562_007228 [Oryza meyeriana var. granulata]|uniref:Uncharacterized protein n=1 Tax=Oryza meyeriana var. granulata TaxID=110450 RepID=A0A6G1CE03_9ORYZ|nr:hypothetical protein E2562_007228 [Oryza meyeriana var. granulata]